MVTGVDGREISRFQFFAGRGEYGIRTVCSFSDHWYLVKVTGVGVAPSLSLAVSVKLVPCLQNTAVFLSVPLTCNCEGSVPDISWAEADNPIVASKQIRLSLSRVSWFFIALFFLCVERDVWVDVYIC